MISVIVTAYKTATYLTACIESILHQSTKDFELILVDNASPDDCGQIIDQYAQKDTRIKSVHLTVNDGPGGGRNMGLSVCKGEYICFIDSDDTVHPTYLEHLMHGLCNSGADMSWCGVQCQTDTETCLLLLSNENCLLYGKEKMLAYISGKSAPLAPWGKLYTRQLIWNFKYALGALDDAPVQYKLYLNAEKIAYVAKPLYIYYERSTSTTKAINDSVVQRQLMMTEGFYHAYYATAPVYPEICKQMYSAYVKSLCGAYNIAIITQCRDTAQSIWETMKAVHIDKLSDEVFNHGWREQLLLISLKYCKPLIKGMAILNMLIKRCRGYVLF